MLDESFPKEINSSAILKANNSCAIFKLCGENLCKPISNKFSRFFLGYKPFKDFFNEISLTNLLKILFIFVTNNDLISYDDDMACHLATRCCDYNQHHDSQMQQNIIHITII
jgi:hypothetical protein